MYEFRAETPTQYDFMSRVSPCRFEAKSSHKMGYSFPQKEYPFLSSYLLFHPSLWHSPPQLSFVRSSFPIEKEELGLGSLVMRSRFAWLEITEWLGPLLAEDMFCFWTQMGFSHWHEPIFDCFCEWLWAEYRTGSTHSLLISVSMLWCTIMPMNLLPRSICEIRKGGQKMKGKGGRMIISLCMLQLNTLWQVQLLSVLNGWNVSCSMVVWHEHKSLVICSVGNDKSIVFSLYNI